MKRLSVVSAAALFFAATCAAVAGVTMSDIWRWGLLRNTDILPVGSTITYMTGGVLRVVEAYDQTDTNRFRMTVSTPLVDGVTAVLSNGVYESGTITNDGGTLSAAFTNNWLLTYTPTPDPVYAWRVDHGSLTNGTNFVAAATNVYADAGFVITNAGDYGVLSVTATGTSFVVSAYTNWTFEVTNGVDVGGVTNLVLINAVDTNALPVLLALVCTNWAAPYYVLTNSAGTNGNAWGASATLDATNDLIIGIAPTGGVAVGRVWVGYRPWVFYVTNDFHKTASDMVFWANITNFIQDAVEDLRIEISEAIEAHVELLHP